MAKQPLSGQRPPSMLAWMIGPALLTVAMLDPSLLGRIASFKWIDRNIVILSSLAYAAVMAIGFRSRIKDKDKLFIMTLNLSLVGVVAAAASIHAALVGTETSLTHTEWIRLLIVNVAIVFIMVEFAIVIYRWSTAISVPLVAYFIALYLRTMAAFAMVYTYIETLGPHEFLGLQTHNKVQMLFYSASVLTSTGIGAVVPEAQAAQVVTMVEMLFGLFLTAVVIAILVAKALNQGRREPSFNTLAESFASLSNHTTKSMALVEQALTIIERVAKIKRESADPVEPPDPES